MINQRSLDAHLSFKDQFMRPLYSSYCFSRIPGTIRSLFNPGSFRRLPAETTGNKEYEHVVLFLIDGFGWRFFEHYLPKYPFLKRIVEQGIASKLTAQFPSTTAAHVTCLNTGLEGGVHGVYEWFYYEPKLDRIIAPLLFSFAGDKQPDSLKASGVTPEEIYPNHTFYQDLEKEGVSSYIFQHESIVNSSYSHVMLKSAESISYHTIEEGLRALCEKQKSQQGKKSYFYFYFGDIDSAGHRYGTFSEKFNEEVDLCFKNLESIFYRSDKKGKTACILIADHGMTMVDPKTTFYLNEKLPECIAWFKKNKKGQILAPAGSCRDFFLHIDEKYLDEAKQKLEAALKDVAAVFYTRDLIREKLFCEGEVSETFLQRVGNLVILPYANQSVWWHEKGRFEQHFYAMHGGLTKEELEIPFLFFEL